MRQNVNNDVIKDSHLTIFIPLADAPTTVQGADNQKTGEK